MRNYFRATLNLFQTTIAKIGGALVFGPTLWKLWKWAEPMIDTIGRVDLVWQFRSIVGLILSGGVRFILSPVGTLLTVLVGFILIVLGRAPTADKAAENNIATVRERKISDSTPSGGVLYAPTVIQGPPPQIFVTQIRAEFGPINDGYIRIDVTFVCCADGFALDKLASGNIIFVTGPVAPSSREQQSQLIELDTPRIEGVTSLSYPTYEQLPSTFPIQRGDCVIHLRQHLSPVEIAAMQAVLLNPFTAPKRKLDFDFSNLDLNLVYPDASVKRFPLWDGVSCASGYAFNKIAARNVSVSVGVPKMK
jgi:hypothetical protein